MSTNTQTLDARIRGKARRDHQTVIDQALAPVNALLFNYEHHHGGDNTGIECPGGYVTDDSKKFLRVEQLIILLKQVLVALTTPDAEEKAVAEFIAKVDGLQAQLDELQGEIEDRG